MKYSISSHACCFRFIFLCATCFEIADQKSLISQSGSVTIAPVTPPLLLGEGPYWSSESETLYFVDIVGEKIYKLDPRSTRLSTSSACNGPVSYIIGVDRGIDYFIIGCLRNMTLIRWKLDNNASVSIVSTLTTVDDDRTDTRFNDGKIDIAGRFWGGTMGPECGSHITHNRGSLYSIDYNLKPVKKVSPVSVSNGIAWNKDNTIMYYIDSLARRIVSFNYDPVDGTISHPEIIFNFDSYNLTGVPDGMTIDSEDNLWVANHGGGHVININPKNGELLQTIDIPASRVTSVTFGDTLLDTLYVTTANFGLSMNEKQKQPNAGCVFAIKGLGVRGLAPNKFTLHKS